MARTVTRSDLVLRIRQRADIEGNQHVTDAEIQGLINTHLPEYYDLLVECVPDYFSTTQTITTDGLTSDYALPADFYKTTIVLVQDASGRLMPIQPVNDWYQNVFEIPAAGYVVKHLYVGAAPVLSSDSDTVDGINGFEELIVLRCAIDIKNKREEDPRSLMDLHGKLTARVRKMAQRDRGMPPTVRQIETGPRDPFWHWDSLVSGYRIRGGVIQLLTSRYQPWLGVLSVPRRPTGRSVLLLKHYPERHVKTFFRLMKSYRTDRVTQEVCKDPAKLSEYLTRREDDVQKALRSAPRRYVEYSLDITSTATAYQLAHPFGNSAVRWWIADVVVTTGSSGLISAHRTALDPSTIALTLSTQSMTAATVVVHLEAADG